jgi:hypothetical protein
MFEKRLITALLDQAAILSVAVEALVAGVKRYDQGYEIESLLSQAEAGLLQACSSLSELERLLAAEEQD